jgi:hypothetical protein
MIEGYPGVRKADPHEQRICWKHPPVSGEHRSDWERVRALRDADIAHDEDNPRTRAADWAGATLTQGGVPLGKVHRRGPGKKSPVC